MQSTITLAFGLTLFASRVASHGVVTDIMADGIHYQGYHPEMRDSGIPPTVVGWATDNSDLGPVWAQNLSTDAIACHFNATPAASTAKVTAGTNVTMYWINTWAASHQGPMMDYLAACPNNDCTTADRTQLKFFKISEVGLIDKAKEPNGLWGSDVMFQTNKSWTVEIPPNIAPGQYVLRHEILALHEADRPGGIQMYPQCLNLDVQGGGSDRPEGVLGTELYTEGGPGMEYDIYQLYRMGPYTMPGPALYNG